MTHRDENGVIHICVEDPTECELCGAIEETRPYGPNGTRVCFTCGMKDKDEASRRFNLLVDGQ